MQSENGKFDLTDVAEYDKIADAVLPIVTRIEYYENLLIKAIRNEENFGVTGYYSFSSSSLIAFLPNKRQGPPLYCKSSE